MSRVLLIEDETKIREKIETNLRAEGFDVQTMGGESEFSVGAVVSAEPVVLVMDRLMGQFDTLEALEEIKKRMPSVGILILSAIDSPMEKAKALETGADDYLAKPFSMTELVARVKALQRRIGAPTRSQFIELGRAILDLEGRVLIVEGKRHQLSNKEFGLLRLLGSAPGRVFSKDQILERVWEAAYDVESNSVETAITALRRRLEAANAGLAIKNMRQVGYWVEIQGL